MGLAGFTFGSGVGGDPSREPPAPPRGARFGWREEEEEEEGLPTARTGSRAAVGRWLGNFWVINGDATFHR